MATLTDLARRIAQDIRPLRYDSGLRDITSLAGDKIASGAVHLRRTGRTVTLSLVGPRPSSTMGGGTLFTIPPGFRRPARWDGYIYAGMSGGTAVHRTGYLFTAGGFGINVPTTSDTLRLDLTWITDDPPPTTPPGSPA